MAVMKVAYDLNNPRKDYTPLLAALRRLDSFHAQKSLWYVSAATTAHGLRDALQSFVDEDDTLSVSQMFKGCWATVNMAEAARWLEAHGV